jgi:S-disulfanyl-L-cysteine oxidoreductase SoxD
VNHRFLVTGLILLLTPAALGAQWGGPAYTKTVLDAVYTADQATRGQDLYAENCASCHRDTLFGGEQPRALILDRFMNRWSEESLAPLFTKMKTTMPQNAPGRLNDSEYLEVLAYILKANGFPAGSQALKVGDLGTIQLVNANGPQPLPTNAAIQVVGCLKPGANNSWELANASSYARTQDLNEHNAERTQDLNEHNAEESKLAAGVPLGSRTLPLQNFEFLPGDVKVDAYTGHKVHLKGVLNRRNNVERINVTWFETLSSTCTP